MEFATAEKLPEFREAPASQPMPDPETFGPWTVILRRDTSSIQGKDYAPTAGGILVELPRQKYQAIDARNVAGVGDTDLVEVVEVRLSWGGQLMVSENIAEVTRKIREARERGKAAAGGVIDTEHPDHNTDNPFGHIPRGPK